MHGTTVHPNRGENGIPRVVGGREPEDCQSCYEIIYHQTADGLAKRTTESQPIQLYFGTLVLWYFGTAQKAFGYCVIKGQGGSTATQCRGWTAGRGTHCQGHNATD